MTTRTREPKTAEPSAKPTSPAQAIIRASWEAKNPPTPEPKGDSDKAQTTKRTSSTTPTAEPIWRRQLDEKGLMEKVDIATHKHQVVCACGGIRWVKPQDVFQVRACKPCMAAERQAKALERAKSRRQRKSAAKKAEAMAEAGVVVIEPAADPEPTPEPEPIPITNDDVAEALADMAEAEARFKADRAKAEAKKRGKGKKAEGKGRGAK